MNRKNGNVVATLGIIITVTIFLCFFLLYYQINTISNSIKKDLFYISNNIIIAMDKEELLFGNYSINTEKSREVIQELLRKNHEKGYVKEITIKDLSFDINSRDIVIHITVKIKFTPLIYVGSKSEHEFTLKEDTKISLLKYN